ncbi:MAG TPA: CAP domain-containing protein [Pricia sp.]|nr:CAP domain-containing protein [Pricia sp.]
MKIRTHYVALLVLVCALTSCSKTASETLDIVETENLPEVERELLNTINGHRVSLGKNSLEFDAVAYGFANSHTDYMIAKGTINHDDFSERASQISMRTDAEFVAENVAKDYTTASDAFQGWLNSTKHKRTMEDNFTHTAVSVKKGADGTLYFTQIFYR